MGKPIFAVRFGRGSMAIVMRGLLTIPTCACSLLIQKTAKLGQNQTIRLCIVP